MIKLFLCSLVVLFSSCAVNNEYIPRYSEHPLGNEITFIAEHRIQMTKIIVKKKNSYKVQESIVELQNFFNAWPQTQTVLTKRQDQELLQTYCDLGRRILEDLSYHLERHGWKEALQSLDRIRSMEQNLLRDFANVQ